MTNIKKIFSNKVLQYVFSRYLVYFIQFVNSLLIAVYLGPIYLGIWGFINLVIQYFEQLNFGLTQSFNALGAIHKKDMEHVSKLFTSTLFCIGIVSGLAVLLFYINNAFELGVGDKYNFSQYAPIVVVAVVLNYFLPAFLSLLRIYGNILTIVIIQSLQPLCVFSLIHFWRGQDLLNVLVWTFIVSFSISIVLYLYKVPIRLNFELDLGILRTVVKKGLYLFMYSGSFYFILLSTKGFISSSFSVEKFGLFTFAFSLGNTILLLFKSFVLLIFPKVINRLAHLESNEAMNTINNARKDYVTMAHLVGHLAILVFPVFIYFFPKYIDTILAFNFIVLSLIVYTHCFGYQEFLIAKGKDRDLGLIAFVSLLVNVFVAFVLIKFVHVDFQYVILSTMVSYLLFLLLLVYRVRTFLGLASPFKVMISAIFPVRLMVPFLASLIISLFDLSLYLYFIPLIAYIVINIKYLGNLKVTFMRILNNPNVVDI